MSILFLSFTSLALAGSKVDVCHKGKMLNISGSALSAHFGHDDSLPLTWYLDTDGDGYGDPLAASTACAQPAGTVSNDEDCDPDDAAVNPGATEVCNGFDDDCDGSSDGPDAADATVFYGDLDGDGFGNASDSELACTQPGGTSTNDDDCNDANAAVNPAALETCSNGDDDCDGLVDEGDATDAGTWYSDEDGDSYGDPASSVDACEVPTGYVPDNTDCDDLESLSFPGNPEVCDLVDNDCDLDVDEDAVDAFPWYADDDSDGYGAASELVLECEAPLGYVADSQDCDDGDDSVSPAGEEVCDTLDNDCDAVVDEPDASDAPIWYADLDSDGFGDADNTARACDQPVDYVADDLDCDDGDSSSSPDGVEVCDDSIDQDCSGADEECQATEYCVTLDCDEYGDLVVANNATTGSPFSRAVDSYGYLGDGRTFALDASLPTAGTQGVDVADLDGDGFLDIIFANWSPNEGYAGAISSYVYWGSSSGYSASDRLGLTTQGALDAATGDFDHDGWLDVVFAEYNGTSTVFYGGAGGLGSSGSQDLSCAGSSAVEGADVDGDGILDVVLQGSAGACVFPSTEGGTTSSPFSPLGKMAIGDFDGDGLVDAAVGYGGATDVDVYLGNGDGSFDTTPWQTIPLSTLSGSIETADFNGDGALDLVCGANGSDTVQYIPWDLAAGEFGDAVAFTVAGEAAGRASTGDLDGDGYNDVALPLGYSWAAGSRWHEAVVFWGGPDGLSVDVTTSVEGLTPYGTKIVTADSIVGQDFVDVCVGGVAKSVRGATAGSYLDAGATWPETWYSDVDGDGFGDASSPFTSCDTPTNGVEDSTDCDDSDADSNPDGVEVCDDGIDQDCSGADEECEPFTPLSGTGAPADAAIDLDGTGVALYLGLPITNVGDTNGDGTDDILVGAHGTGSKRGAALLYESPFSSSMTASDYEAIFNGLDGGSYGDEAGLFASQHGDVDGDGTVDLAVGANLADLFAVNGGATYIVSGQDGYTGMGSVDLNSEAYARIGSSTFNGYLGQGSAVGDQDGDGDNEVFVAGTYGVFMIEDLGPGDFDIDTDNGPDDRWLTAVRGFQPISSFDYNGDGLHDLAVGTAASYSTSAGGYTALRTGPILDGDLNATPVAGEGWTVGVRAGQIVASDLDGDGYDDVLFGGDATWSVSYLYSGNSSAAALGVATFQGNLSSAFGHTKAAVGDMDEDGEQDLAFGAFYDDTSGYERGAVYLYHGPFSGSYGVGDAAYTMLGDKSGNQIGTGVAAAGDATGDGHLDLWVGAHAYNEVLLISGAGN
jgi:FG-GAP-like repeat/Putative metal-binding motif